MSPSAKSLGATVGGLRGLQRDCVSQVLERSADGVDPPRSRAHPTQRAKTPPREERRERRDRVQPCDWRTYPRWLLAAPGTAGPNRRYWRSGSDLSPPARTWQECATRAPGLPRRPCCPDRWPSRASPTDPGEMDWESDYYPPGDDSGPSVRDLGVKRSLSTRALFRAAGTRSAALRHTVASRAIEPDGAMS